ncbi:UNVERIFIED_CONTAM: Retrovirus-related Pol polyprotein from transposon TNT 1-94 [Sesamum latifolium]|uniref:Retrovirus-related Pol polyprotein from transposon TNT 1-94 n=1 Tax=Sesamum latifolium TaxID=2727402 RepID=A0AAW2XNX6_9LAMI
MNRTLLNKVRCLLISSGLSKTFWGEALLTAAYLINRSPFVPLNGKLPECVWSGKNVDLSSIRIFGCSAFALHNGDKLDPRAQKCIFIGYPISVKGYRLWLRSQLGFKVIISRDVTFNETKMPYLSSSHKNHHNSDIKSIFNKVETYQIDNQQREENELEENQQVDNPPAPPPDHNTYQLARDRERRESRIPTKFRDYHLALNTETIEPYSYEEALESRNSEKWKTAMEEGINSLMKNKTWTLVPKPKDTSIVDCKWLFKIKQENESTRYKARLVAKGFTQKEGIDFTEIFSLVVKYTTVRIFLALTAHFNMELKQMDVKTAFLHGDLD